MPKRESSRERQGAAMPITASVLSDLLHCPQRVALDALGDRAARDEINPFVRLLWERGTLYERATIAKIEQAFLDLSGFEGAEQEWQTLQAMQRGEPLIYSGRISTDDLLGVPVRKIENGGSLKNLSFGFNMVWIGARGLEQIE
jgi:hypothetical protein